MSDESKLYKLAMIRIDELVEEVIEICDEVAEKKSLRKTMGVRKV